ncbi:MAG: glycosyltransferase [Acidimicrobiia bacterium]
MLVLATTVPVESGDGTPAFVLDLASALTDEMTVSILAPRVPEAARVTTIDGVTVRRFGYFPRRWEGLANGAIMPTLRAEPWRWIEVPALVGAMIVRTVFEAWRTRADVLHAHWILPGGLAASCAAALLRKPYIVTVHGADVYTLRGRRISWLKRKILTRARAVMPVSQDIRSMVIDLAEAPDNITSAVPMGVAAPEVRDAGRRAADSFLIVGRLAQKKGIGIAINAFSMIDRGDLVVVGDGPLRSTLESAVDEANLNDRVRFVGRQPREEVLDHMRRCTALLIPSVVAPDGDTDGTPVVLAEAMSLGTPVIASRIAGLADHIEDGRTGWLVEPGDVEALAEALVRGMGDTSGLDRLGASAAQYFTGGALDMATTAREYRSVLRGLAP